jgi:hypothetical protein
MLQWICRHHHHKLFMVMQDMHPMVECLDLHTSSNPVGTDMSHNPKLEVHHGKAQAAKPSDVQVPFVHLDAVFLVH